MANIIMTINTITLNAIIISMTTIFIMTSNIMAITIITNSFMTLNTRILRIMTEMTMTWHFGNQPDNNQDSDTLNCNNQNYNNLYNYKQKLW
jgi:hypothetical protein